MDEIVVNANQLENSIQATTACLWRTTLPFSVDPVLWRFQEPAWTRNNDGEIKRNYKRLGLAYGKGTGIRLGATPLMEAIATDEQWRTIAKNAIDYQRGRLRDVPTQLELLADLRDLDPVRLVAPSLVAYSPREDRINRLMIEASALEAQASVAVEVIVPGERLADRPDLRKMIDALPVDDVSAYLVWAPTVTEAQLQSDHGMLTALMRMIGELSARGIAVGHQYANFTVAALHDVGLSSVTHHLGWVDKGEPVEAQGIAMRSCQMYVPGVRQCVRFNEAANLGLDLGPQEYAERYCECTFCTGMFETGQHPFDLLLETQTFTMKNGRKRQIPTSRAVGANTWHYLLSRRNEVEAFSLRPAVEVIEAAIERASALNRGSDVARLGHLATEVQSA
jgi:hypothetical protein